MKKLDIYKFFISQAIERIKEEHLEASEKITKFSKNTDNPEQSFIIGERFGYCRSLEILQLEAQLLEIPLKEIGLDFSS